MPITVTERVIAAIEPEATVTLSVRSPHAHAATRAAAEGIATLGDGPKYVSPPVPVPGGALLLVDFGSTPAARLATVPRVVANAIEAAGVTDATVDLPDRIDDRYLLAESHAPAARAWLRWPVPADPDPATLAWLWDAVRHHQATRGAPTGVISSAEIPLAWDDLPGTADAVLRAGWPLTAVVGDLTSAVSACAIGLGYRVARQASLTDAAADWSPTDVTTAMTAQRDILRAGARHLAWAAVQATSDARHLLMPQWIPPPAGNPVSTELLSDIAVPDAAWYQILSPGHLTRLRTPPADANPIGGGRVELTIGTPEQWLPDHPDHDTVVTHGRELLAPCLLDPEEATRLSRERIMSLRSMH